MGKVLRATSGCLASVGIALLALAALSLPTQAASASAASACALECEADLPEDTCTCVDLVNCKPKHCWRTYPYCNGWCLVLCCGIRGQEGAQYCACGNF